MLIAEPLQWSLNFTADEPTASVDASSRDQIFHCSRL